MRGGVELTAGRYVQTVSYVKRRLNEKAVGLTKFGKAQRVTDLLCSVLNVMSYSSQTFFSANKFAILSSVDLLHYVC